MALPLHFPCYVDEVIDGDTFDVEVDHGFHIFSRQRVRLAHVDCPEMGTAAGRAAKQAVIQWLDSYHHALTLVSYANKDKYGRRICDLVNANQQQLSVWLAENGHAVFKEYR